MSMMSLLLGRRQKQMTVERFLCFETHFLLCVCLCVCVGVMARREGKGNVIEVTMVIQFQEPPTSFCLSPSFPQ